MRRFKKTLWVPIVLMLAMIMGVGCQTTKGVAAKATEQAKADWTFHAIEDVGFVQQYAKVPQPEGVMIIDSRPLRPKYVKGHIPTAVNIPDSQFEKMTDKLPQDKNTLLIFYCGGPT